MAPFVHPAQIQAQAPIDSAAVLLCISIQLAPAHRLLSTAEILQDPPPDDILAAS
ncbi:hypothetical protein D3C77_270610 [compost metagenome]